MRKLKLRFVIPEKGDTKIVSDIFKAFLESRQEGDNFSISDHKLNLAVLFDDPSNKILSLISELPFYNIELLNFEEVTVEGEKDSKEAEKSEGKATETTTPETPIKVVQETKSDETEAREPKIALVKPKGGRKNREMDDFGRAVFEKTAKEAKSYEDFISKMGEFIGVNDYYQVFFYALVQAASSLDEVNMDKISSTMSQFGEGFNSSKKVAISQMVKNAFRNIGSEARFLAFLNEIVKYKNYDFSCEAENEAGSSEETQIETEAKSEVEDTSKEVSLKILPQEALEICAGIGEPGVVSFPKVEKILDLIVLKKDEEYASIRDDIVRIMVRTIKDLGNGETVKLAVSGNADKIFGNKGYMAEAFIYQTIKDYCQSVGYEGQAMYEAFFEDLTRVM